MDVGVVRVLDNDVCANGHTLGAELLVVAGPGRVAVWSGTEGANLMISGKLGSYVAAAGLVAVFS